ncbi:MAG: ATP-binding protein [Pirellulales bacterium]
MSISAWSDDEVSKTLPDIRAAGEGQHAEFKREFPPQLHTLATEVAAFATSGGGMILIGVDDDGNVVGLDPDQHDKAFHSTQNVIQQVQPRVEQKISLCYDDGCILVIDVAADQREPVYYYDQRPYVRVGRTSRRATPDEVKERVWAHPSSDHRRKMEELQYEPARREEDIRHEGERRHQDMMNRIATAGQSQRDAAWRANFPDQS